jgi:YgiT-type zinc finger domain-containing protein
MKNCVSPGCRGEYEPREITHSVTWQAGAVVIDRVPAAVCPRCGGAVLEEVTLSRIDEILRSRRPPPARLAFSRGPALRRRR